MQLLKEFRMGISNANTFLVKQAPIDWLSSWNFLVQVFVHCYNVHAFLFAHYTFYF